MAEWLLGGNGQGWDDEARNGLVYVTPSCEMLSPASAQVWLLSVVCSGLLLLSHPFSCECPSLCGPAGNIVGSVAAAMMLQYGWGWSFLLPGAFIIIMGAGTAS